MRLGLAISSLVAAASLMAQGQAPAPAGQPAKKKTPPKRMALFTGYGTSSWLPKASILPSAEDIETAARKLSSRERNMDPFSLPTFPREEDLRAATVATVDRQTERVTLNQALQSLKVTGINLDKKEILFRGRNVYQGDVMVLSFKDQVFYAQVVDINGTQILFRDVKRQETGVLPHTLLPHLELEPLQKRAGLTGLEGRVSPMESTKSLQQ
jgi:hypothetical protein